MNGILYLDPLEVLYLRALLQDAAGVADRVREAVSAPDYKEEFPGAGDADIYEAQRSAQVARTILARLG